MKRTLLSILSISMIITAACGSSNSDGDGGSPSSSGFHVTGTLSSTTLSGGVSSKADSDETVTDVVAVSPTATGVSCRTVSVEDAGTFDAEIARSRIWSFFFINRNRTGSSMFLGWFRGSTMDSLTPNKETGSVDLGTVSVDTTTGTASSTTSESEIISDLGMDSDTATVIGSQDEVLSRYSNPDVDGDGALDCSSNSNNYLLDFHIRYDISVNGEAVEVNNLVDSFIDESLVTFDYNSTGVYVAYLNTFSSATSGIVKFVDTEVITESDGTVSANTEISDTTENAFGEYNGFGVNLTSSSNLPSGSIIFEFGDKTLTYSNVVTPELSNVQAASNRIFPFIKITKSDSGCVSDCSISSISYKWMKKSDSGWTEAVLEEVTLLVAEEGSNFGFRVGGDSEKNAGFIIPVSAVSGTIEWNSSNAALNGITSDEFDLLTIDDICHVGLSYDDNLGMRYFQNIENSNENCTS